MTAAHLNSMWIGAVREALRLGFGVEDIAVQLGCNVESVRLEVSILRQSGELKKIYERAEL